jgi:hypothetical protein
LFAAKLFVVFIRQGRQLTFVDRNPQTMVGKRILAKWIVGNLQCFAIGGCCFRRRFIPHQRGQGVVEKTAGHIQVPEWIRSGDLSGVE